MDLKRLREQTAGHHAATEETVPLMSPGLTRAEYIVVLKRLYSMVSAWDRWADAHVPEDLLPLLAGRRRAVMLQRDLEALGADLRADAPFAPGLEGSQVKGDPRSIFLGRMYVMEGSTLGGQFIARHVESALGIAPGHGNSYFQGYGEATGERWREVRAALQALPEGETDTVIGSAREMFTLFGEAMQESPLITSR